MVKKYLVRYECNKAAGTVQGQQKKGEKIEKAYFVGYFTQSGECGLGRVESRIID